MAHHHVHILVNGTIFLAAMTMTCLAIWLGLPWAWWLKTILSVLAFYLVGMFCQHVVTRLTVPIVGWMLGNNVK